MFINKINEFKRQKILNELKKQIEMQKYRNKIIIFKNRNRPFLLREKYNSIIPLNLFTCWHTKELPPLMNNNYQELVNINTEFNHFLYDENDCREFIKKHFDNDVFESYNKLIPCSYKSDLWRFCILYIKGGIYLDIKYNCSNGFKFIALTENEYFVKDRPEDCVYTALIVCKPNNEILLKCINQIVQNVKNKYYGDNPLYPTGPGLLGKFFTNDEKNKMNLYFRDTTINGITKEYILYNNQII
jgi:mannosyltransferase OCH1-like enzyme